MCAVTKQKIYKHPVVQSACVTQPQVLMFIPKTKKDLFRKRSGGAERLWIFHRDWKAANLERVTQFNIARRHPFCFTAPLNSPEISASVLLFTFCVTLLRFGFYKLKPRVLEPGKEAGKTEFQRGSLLSASPLKSLWSVHLKCCSRRPSWGDVVLGPAVMTLLQLMSSNPGSSNTYLHHCFVGI